MRKTLLIIAILVVVAAVVLAGLATFYTDFLWFGHLGFGSVYLKVLSAEVGTGVVFGLACFALLGLHILLIRRFSEPRKEWVFPTAEGDVDIKDLVRKVSTPVVVAGAVVMAAGMGYWAARHWEEVLKVLNQTSFHRTEPILGKDIGFYLFELPFLQFVQEWLVYLTGLVLVLSAVVYFLRGAVSIRDRQLKASDQVRGHLLFGLASVLLVIAWGWRLEMFETLFSKRGVAYGATYTDVHVNLIAYRIMIVACVLAAAYLIYLIWARPQGAKATRRPAYALGGVVALYLLTIFVWPTVVQQLVVNPNELDKERPYLENAIEGTQQAYQLNKVEVRNFPATEDLSWKDVKDARPIVENIKIWDHRPLKATYKQVQVIRLYYDFPAISVDRYRADDRYWQVMLAAREMVVDQLPAQSQTWVNRHLQYTHGYGICLSPVNQVVGEGLPNLWIKDIPPQSRYPRLQIDRPEIYYGQVTDDYALVKTSTKEFDYPKGSENRYTTYAGEGGVPIGSFFRRLLFALRMSDVNLFFTSYLTPQSRIMFNRDVRDRVAAVAPFLMLDQEAYPVVVDGRIYWIQDAYTVSYRYPYSQPTPLGRRRRINYIRNSVKAVVDAYSGQVKLYIWDPADPMAQTYAKMFPALFRTKAQMPPELAAHVRYPKDLFRIQTAMYESFHMTDPQIFYNQEDKWDVSRELSTKAMGQDAPDMTGAAGAGPGIGGAGAGMRSSSRMNPYYMIMKLPGEQQEEFLLMVPFTPSNKDNMVAWMAARCDGKDYGKLLVYTFPKQKLIFGPMQIEARIDQDEYISQWFTLRNQQGSTVIRGDLLVIPIKDSILYVEPIYLQATQTNLPELKQVIVAFGKKLTMKTDLASALYQVFGVSKSDGQGAGAAADAGQGTRGIEGAPGAAIPAVPAAETGKLLQQAMGHYQAAQDRVAKGDWAGYGSEQQALKAALDDLARALGPMLKPHQGQGGKVLPAAPAPGHTAAQPEGTK